MIKIGLVSLDTSHPKTFADILHAGQRARYAAVYDNGFRTDSEVEVFMKKFGISKRCSTIEEMAECVDIGFVHSCNWSKHIDLAMPFIRNKKPVFIDKPIVGSISDCNKIEQLVKDGAVILGSSSARYATEITEFLDRPLEERGEILSIHASSGVDEFNYGIHIVEAICKLADGTPINARHIGGTTRGGGNCDTYYLNFDNGVTATYNYVVPKWKPFDFTIMTTLGTYNLRLDTQTLYTVLLDKICTFVETGENTMATVEELNLSVKALLAARISRKQGGIVVKVEDIPNDDPGYDGDAFEEFYSKTAPKIYND